MLDRLSDNMESCFFIAPDCALIPGSDFQIHGFSGKQRLRNFPRCPGHLLPVPLAAAIGIRPDSEEHLRVFPIQIDKADKFLPIIEGIQVVLRIRKPEPTLFLFLIGKAVVNRVFPGIFPPGDAVFFSSVIL